MPRPKHDPTRMARLLMVVASAAVTATRADAQSITPKFAWPTTAEAEVQSTGVSRTSMAGRDDSSRYVTRSRIAVQPDARGLLVTSGPTQTIEGTVGGSAGAPFVESLMRSVTRFHVSEGGRFIGLTDTVELKRQVDSAAQPFLQQLAALPPQMREEMSGMFSLEKLNRAAERNWWQQTGALVSRAWAPGDSLVVQYSEPLPTFPGAQIAFTQTLRYAGVAACPAGQASSICWRFTGHTSMDMTSMRKGLLQTLKQMGVEDESMIDQVPIPRTSYTQVMIYDAATARPLEISVQTALDVPGAPTMNLPGSTMRSEVVTRYIWK